MATFTTTTTSYTQAANAAAPPSKRFNGVALTVSAAIVAVIAVWISLWVGTENAPVAAVVIIAIGILGAGAMAAFGVPLAQRDSEYNHDVYPEALNRWSRSWQCQRCGTRFVV